MKYVIIGRPNSGKQLLLKKFESKGFKILKMCTTRPSENKADEQHHIFITKEEAEVIPNKFLHMEDYGFEYFTTEKDFLEADVCILNPKGLELAAEAFPDIMFHIIHCVDITDEFKPEDTLMDEFEKQITAKDDIGIFTLTNINVIYTHRWDHVESTADNFTESILGAKRLFEHLKEIVGQAVDLQIVASDEPNYVTVVNSNDTAENYSYERFTDLLLSDPTGCLEVLKCWLTHDIQIPTLPEIVKPNKKPTTES